MLNVVAPGSPEVIHRHRSSSETVVCLRVRVVEEFYDELQEALKIDLINFDV
jgi:hypothetical protein